MGDPVTATAAAAGVVSLVEQVTTFAPDFGRKLVEWADARENNPALRDGLLEKIKDTDALLAAIDSVVRQLGDAHNAGSPSSSLPIMQQRLRSLRGEVGRLHKDASQLDLTKMRYGTYPKLLQDKIRSLKERLDDIGTKASELTSDLQLPSPTEVLSSDVPQEGFIVVRNVEKHPPVGRMDFDDKNTYEARFKDAIFNRPSPTQFGAVAQGLGGVGKSCALRAIGLLEETNRRFPGGTLYMSIGADGGLSLLIDRIADILDEAGGREGASIIRDKDKRSLLHATNTAGKWFQAKACLFLVDDIWCVNGITPASIDQLANLVRHPQSSIAFTARDTKVNFGKKIGFEERELRGLKAQNILLHCASQKHPTSSDARDAFDNILDLCGGLPIRLSASGANVRYFTEGRCAACPEDAWRYFLNRYVQMPVLSVELKESELYLRRTVLMSLDLIDEGQSEKQSKERFAALSVLKKQQYVPIGVAQRLWGVSEEKANEFVDSLERFAIARVQASGQSTGSIGLHDVYLGISQALAAEDGATRRWSKTLIESYATLNAGNSIDGGSHGVRGDAGVQNCTCEGFREWWMGVVDDGYIYRNVCRLMKFGEFYDDLLWLMCSPGWVTKQLRTSGSWQVDEDAQITIDVINSGCTQLSSSDELLAKGFFSVLKHAAHLSAKRVREVAWDGMACFQLYGRMAHLAEENRFVRVFLDEVKRTAPRPWLKPSVGCLPAAGDSLRHEVEVDGELMCFKQVDDTLFICSESMGQSKSSEGESKVSLLLKLYNLESRLEQDTEVVLETAEHESIFGSAALSSSGKRLFVGLYTGDIIVVNLDRCGSTDIANTLDIPHRNIVDVEDSESDMHHETARCSFCPWFCFTGGQHRRTDSSTRSSTTSVTSQPATKFTSKYHLECLEKHRGSSITSVVAGADADGRQFVSGSRDGLVRVWQMKAAEWKSEEVMGGERRVTGVGISADGRRVVSGFSDGTVKVGEMEGAEWRCAELKSDGCHMAEVGISADGRRVVSGYQEGGLTVWEMEGAEWKGTELEADDNNLVYSVGISADGQKVVSGYVSGVVRVWRMEGEAWRNVELMGHSLGVISVWISADGGQVVSGSEDGPVRVWEMDGAEWTSVGVKGHEKVERVMVSADGGRVLCRCWGGAVRVWWMEGMNWTSAELKGDGVETNIMRISADGGRVVIGYWDKTVKVWEMDGKEWKGAELNGDGVAVRDVGLSGDGRRIVIRYEDETVKVWEMDGKEWKGAELNGDGVVVRDVGLSGDGRRIVIGYADGTVRFWEMEQRMWKCKDMKDHEGMVWMVEISADGGRAVSGSKDGTVRVWEMEGGEWRSFELKGHEGGVYGVWISADGRRVAVGWSYGFDTWKWEDGEWIVDTMYDNWKQLLGNFEWPTALDKSLIEQVVKPLGAVYRTASGFFLNLRHEPYVAQVDIAWD